MRTAPTRGWGNKSHSSVSVKVIELIAEEVECAPNDLPQLLYEVVDPDALDRLTQFNTVKIGFTFNGFDVLVRGSDDITISAPEPDRL